MMRKYLQLTRAHTAPLEAAPAAVGALAATGGQITWGVAGWIIYGTLYHLAGYGMNSYTDWIGGEDKRDPNKSHHPLNSGDLSPEVAKITVYTLLVLTAGVGIFMTASGDNSIPAVLLLGVAVLSGSVYNIIEADMKYKVHTICLAHSTVFIIPYISVGGDNIVVALGGFVMMWSWIFFQIAVSGELKDLRTDDSNILRDEFGCEISEEFSTITPQAYTFSVGLRLFILTLFGGVAWLASGIGSALVVMVIGVLSTNEARSMMMEASWSFDRDQAMLSMSVIEVMTLMMFVFSFVGQLTIPVAVYTVAISGVWVLVLNQIEWGTWLAPDV